MTWSARIYDSNGVLPEGATWHACEKCKHFQKNPSLPERVYSACNISKVEAALSTFLTCIDVGADGYMTSGNAKLLCNGFEPISVTH